MNAAPRTTPYEAGTTFSIHWANCPEQMAGLDCETCDALMAVLVAAVDAEQGEEPMPLYRKTALTEINPYEPGMEDGFDAEGHPYIATKEGNHRISPGDVIATGVEGERWPIKASIFAASYEPVDPAP